MAGLTAEQFRKLLPQANNEPITKALATGINAVSTPMNQYKLPEGVPLLGGQSAADLTGLTGAQGVVQDFSRGNLQSGDMRMFDLLGLGAGVAPAARTAVKGGGLLGKEALRQMNEGTGLLGKVAIDPRQFIDAYHGTPKEIIGNKFELSKAGSGSGMDFGYGTYLSESPSVASQYMGDADKFITTVDNKIVDTPTLQSIIRMGGKPEYFIESLTNKLKLQEEALKSASKEEILEGISEYDIAKLDYNSTLNKINEAKSYIGKNIQKKREGNLYKADIPDEQLPYFINWESAQQTPEVIKALKNAGIYSPNKTGSDLYLNVVDKVGSSDAQKSGFQKASEYLNSLGIKGNKYTDKTYGALAKDATNYVSFDPETIKLLERNGKSVGLLDEPAKQSELNSLNPTGGLYVDYTPELRASQPLGKNMTTLDKTMGGSPDDMITIYRGAPKNQKSIVAGDFVTDMPELAQSYTGVGNVLKMNVRRGDVLDDITEPLGNEYIYRPHIKNKPKKKRVKKD